MLAGMVVSSSPDDESDDELVKRFQAGDRSAMSVLFDRYNSQLSPIFSRYRDKSSVKDLQQQTWTNILKGIKNYRPNGKFRNWIFRIAATTTYTFYRNRREQRLAIKVVPSKKVPDPIVQSELTTAIETCVSLLQGEELEIFKAKVYKELKLTEISAQSGIPYGKVVKLFNDACKTVRKCLQTSGMERVGG
jgi:RNA polymerase sigma factor (sigma-70 family)